MRIFLIIKRIDKLNLDTNIYKRLRDVISLSQECLDKLNSIKNLTLRVISNNFDNIELIILPQRLDHLTIIFEKTYKKILF